MSCSSKECKCGADAGKIDVNQRIDELQSACRRSRCSINMLVVYNAVCLVVLAIVVIRMAIAANGQNHATPTEIIQK